MTPRTKGRFILLPMLLCVCLTFCSCGSNESTEKPSAVSSDTAAKDSSPATTAAAGSRDNGRRLSYGFLLRFQLKSQIADHRF